MAKAKNNALKIALTVGASTFVGIELGNLLKFSPGSWLWVSVTSLFAIYPFTTGAAFLGIVLGAILLWDHFKKPSRLSKLSDFIRSWWDETALLLGIGFVWGLHTEVFPGLVPMVNFIVGGLALIVIYFMIRDRLHRRQLQKAQPAQPAAAPAAEPTAAPFADAADPVPAEPASA